MHDLFNGEQNNHPRFLFYVNNEALQGKPGLYHNDMALLQFSWRLQ